LYPSLVESVLIGGEPLTADNFRPISDTKIEVVAPNTRGSALPVVVKTSQGFSNADIAITIKGAATTRRVAIPLRTTAPERLAIAAAATRPDPRLLGQARHSLEQSQRHALPARSAVMRDPAQQPHFGTNVRNRTLVLGFRSLTAPGRTVCPPGSSPSQGTADQLAPAGDLP
jgi:hypothetical protein